MFSLIDNLLFGMVDAIVVVVGVLTVACVSVVLISVVLISVRRIHLWPLRGATAIAASGQSPFQPAYVPSLPLQQYPSQYVHLPPLLLHCFQQTLSSAVHS